MHDLPTGTITLLFTDIEGSTQLLLQLGERYATTLDECRGLLRDAFQKHHGYEVDTQGDAFFVAFARATDAVAAATAAQRALFTHTWPEGVVVRVRMGLHTGEPQRSFDGYIGLDFHRAARIMSAGSGGRVLLSRTTRDLVEHALPEEVDLLDLGMHRLKDLLQPIQLFQLVIADLPAGFPPLKTLDGYHNNLPIQPTPFIGREKVIEIVQQLLLNEDVHFVTLTGPGGVGKTRMALHVAAALSQYFTDGTWFVSLAPISDPDLVIPTITQTLGLREARDQSLLEQLSSYLHEKKVLLLLDNFEQVVSAAMEVAELLLVCPGLKVLVTSRERLHVRAEREFPVPAMIIPDSRRLPELSALTQYEAVALFIERAQAVKPDFQLTNANASAVAEICSRLDGLPLAIELASARIKLFPPQTLLTRLEQRLPLLTNSARDVPARQQTLRKAIQWSYDLLTAQEQRFFRWLSVFAGGCTWRAVEAVSTAFGNGSPPVLDIMASLIDKNLLQQMAQGGEEIRLTMLETIREYGMEALSGSGEMKKAQQAHAAYCHSLAEEAESVSRGAEQEEWFRRLELEHDNVRAALHWLIDVEKTRESIDVALRLASALYWFWASRSHMSEGRLFLEKGLARGERIIAPVRAKAFFAAGMLAWFQGDYIRSRAWLQESLVTYRELGDQHGIAYAADGLGRVAWANRDYAEARLLLEESVSLLRSLGDNWGLGYALQGLARVVSSQGETGASNRLLEESMTLLQAFGSREDVAWVNLYWGRALLNQGDRVRVPVLLEEGGRLFGEVNNKWGMAYALRLQGKLALEQGDIATAQPLFMQSLMYYREAGDQRGVALSFVLLASLSEIQKYHDEAATLYKKSIAIAQTLDLKGIIASCLEGLGRVAAIQEEPVWGARLWGAAEALRETSGEPRPIIDRPIHDPSVEAVRTHLGEKAFAAARSEGRRLTPEQALASRSPVLASPSTVVKARPIYPAGLTAREVEVLRLVAQGLTDAQVADRLVISPRTVNAHLTSLYNKIGVDSRVAATRFAVEQQLLES